MTKRPLYLYFAPQGPSARVFVACYMLVSGVARIITGNSASGGVNIFSARVFGAFLFASGLALFLTVLSRYRFSWHGRLCAIAAAVIWSLLIAQAWPARAWVSISGALVYIAFLLNEVRANGR